MTDHRLEGPGENGAPVPRDLPDQQAGTGEDPWEAAPSRAEPETADDTEEQADRDEPADRGGTDVPDTDEAGTGRRGAPRSGNVHPEHPEPDESSG
ncbi:hypothetical protein [Streptomyces sp. JHA26]|uniref:hypothetical protein n=1 Tax=Streptomyces sp. JHA26 TaxID=1917143 RepID=UPI000989B745|nr:hypothetical protein [Streptomyces sp. JHA26]